MESHQGKLRLQRVRIGVLLFDVCVGLFALADGWQFATFDPDHASDFPDYYYSPATRFGTATIEFAVAFCVFLAMICLWRALKPAVFWQRLVAFGVLAINLEYLALIFAPGYHGAFGGLAVLFTVPFQLWIIPFSFFVANTLRKAIAAENQETLAIWEAGEQNV